MQRALVAALGTRWWVTALAQEDDPISLEPLRKLRYPPFECRTDPSLPHRTSSDWFDGRVLAHYLVATANFVHPISRRELSRVECVKPRVSRLHGEPLKQGVLRSRWPQRPGAGK